MMFLFRKPTKCIECCSWLTHSLNKLIYLSYACTTIEWQLRQWLLHVVYFTSNGTCISCWSPPVFSLQILFSAPSMGHCFYMLTHRKRRASAIVLCILHTKYGFPIATGCCSSSSVQRFIFHKIENKLIARWCHSVTQGSNKQFRKQNRVGNYLYSHCCDRR